MGKRTKLLVLCMDAGDSKLILEWARKGSLPTFRSLLERGAWGHTSSPAGLFVGAIWPSFWTGVSPARHGRYCYNQIVPGEYTLEALPPSKIRGRAFWDQLAEQGRRVAVIDVPKTVPSTRPDVVQVVDWGTHDPEHGFGTCPPALAADIASRFGRHPIRGCDAPRRNTAQLAALRDGLLRGVALKADLSSHYLAQGGWDLFLTVFPESHCAGHQFWHVHDPSHPRHDAESAAALGDPIEDVYAAIDAGVGRLLAEAGEDTRTLVLASHGMGPHYDATFLLDDMLRARETGRVAPGVRRTASLLDRGWTLLPEPARKLLRPMRGRVKQRLGEAIPNADLAARRCYATPNNDVYGGIRINLVGREPSGRVRPGADLDWFCEELTRDLGTFVNTETGRPLVRRVLRTAEQYRGEPTDHLPDLLVEWNREAPIRLAESPTFGQVGEEYQGNRTGDHTQGGLVIGVGPGVGPTHLEVPLPITRLAPTIAALLGAQLEDGAPPIVELVGADPAIR